MERELDDRLLVRHAVLITLERESERREKFMQRWEQLQQRYGQLRAEAGHPERSDWPDLELTTLYAYDGAVRAPQLEESAGVYGCLRSHLAALRQSPSGPHAPLWILEDDAVFADDAIERLQGVRLPSNWEIFWVGAEHRIAPEHVTNDGETTGIVKVRAAQRGHCYVVRSPAVIHRQMAPLTGFHDHLLSGLAVAQYALWPGAAGQDAGESSITAGSVRAEPMFWNERRPVISRPEFSTTRDVLAPTLRRSRTAAGRKEEQGA